MALTCSSQWGSAPAMLKAIGDVTRAAMVHTRPPRQCGAWEGSRERAGSLNPHSWYCSQNWAVVPEGGTNECLNVLVLL